MGISRGVEDLINNAPVSAHLATSVNDRPHVAPVWYGYHENVLYFMTGGKKLQNLRENPRVSISIEAAVNSDVDWNVTLFGHTTIHNNETWIDWATDWIYDKYDDDTTPNPSPPDPPTGQDDETEVEYPLVAVTVGSATANTYE